MSDHRGLAVFADGLQVAFAAGAVAELAGRGRRWGVVIGAGLGAQVAVLAGLGEAEEAARRWQRQGEQGCPLLAPLAEEASNRLAGLAGAIAWLDPWRLSGWLAPVPLAEHLAPEAAGVPARLARRGVQAFVLTQDVGDGNVVWEPLGGLEPGAALDTLTAACTFPGGWGPHQSEDGRRRWGGVGLLAAAPSQVLRQQRAWDVVCGFPLPPADRRWTSLSLFEQLQRRDEALAALTVTKWGSLEGEDEVLFIAPTADAWRSVENRDHAELGLEYPLPWERNGVLVGHLLAAGRAAARRALGDGR